MLKTNTYLTLLFLGSFFSSEAQFFNRDNWQDKRHQLEFGIGASNFMGELGGKDAIGTNDLQDFEIQETLLAAFVGYKWTMYKKWHIRTNLTYGQLSGDDKLTAEPFRNNRNLSFRSNIFEATLLLEFEIPINKRKGHIYDIRGVRGWTHGGSSLYLFAGVGGLYFNPKTNVDGQWVELRPLRTEGQGLPDGPDEYKPYSWCLPVGLTISKRISPRTSVGIELTYRYTFTDYIDDVSTEYYNPQDIALYVGGEEGQLASYLSNPSLGLAQEGLPNNVTAPGQQRGDETDNDGYMFGWVKCQYLLSDANRKTKGFNTKKRRYKKRKTKKVIF
jgi:hypothetical protein